MRAALLLLMAAFLWAAPAHAQPAELRSEAFENAQKAMSGAASRALSQLGARFGAGSDDLAQAVRQRQDLIEAWRQADRRLVQATASQSGFSNIEALREQAGILQNSLAQSEDDLSRRFPAYAELATPKPLSIAATQALLSEDEALVLILNGRKESFVFALTAIAADAKRVEMSASSLAQIVKSLRLGLNPASPAVMRSGLRNMDETQVESGHAASIPVFERAKAHQIYKLFLEPFEALLKTKKRLFFVLEAPLDSLPLALLVTDTPSGSDTDPAALRATQWLIKRHAIGVLPSVSSLKALRASMQRASAPEPFRGYGAPVLGGSGAPVQVATRSSGTAASVMKDGLVDVEAVRALAPLPKTAGELARLADALKAPSDSIRLGEAATISALKEDDLKRFRVLAFATHGLLAGEVSGLAEPALVFTPPLKAREGDNGLLTASEAAKLDLAADWVVLSACNTASGDGTPGAEGLSGLARAFFYAGAKSLLVSHWPVRDDAAARLTTDTFARLSADHSRTKADAFREAVLALIADPADPAFAHPAIWAPFIVVGEAR